ncbi:MAG TPA: nuclease-related domain-containing protein [Chloroflexia bacterium]|nr:nuclease-related domain-containing protein [Chloroflexia bacterium]
MSATEQMNTFTNEHYLKDQLRRAKRLQLFGVLSIFLSFFLSFGFGVNYFLVYLAYPFLLAGLPLWTIGRATVRRLGMTPRADHLLTNELKALNNKHTLHHYATVGGKTINHLLIAPAGVLIMQSSESVGPVTCQGGPNGDRWKSKSNILDRLTGLRPPVGNPTKDLDAATSVVRQLLTDSGKPNVPVKGLIVFTTNPDLEIEECTYPAVPLSEVRQATRELLLDIGGDRAEGSNVDAILTSEDRRRINLALSPQAPPVPAKPASAQR